MFKFITSLSRGVPSVIFDVDHLERAGREAGHAKGTLRRPRVITGRGNDARSQAMKGNDRGTGFSMTAG